MKLSDEQKAQFEQDGYIILPSFLDDEWLGKLKADVDRLEADRKKKERSTCFPAAYGSCGDLIVHDEMMDTLQQLFPDKYTMHHIHAVRQEAGNPGVPWHQDYEQIPQTNRSHLMVHIFYYMNGLNGTVGDLLVCPGTQHQVMDRSALKPFGWEDLPGTAVVDDIPPGTAVIVHSALFHARRPKPGDNDRPRYFIDISYCQQGIKWPAYGSMKEVNAIARERNLVRDGKYDYVFDDDAFFDDSYRKKYREHLEGSLIYELGKDA